MAAKNYEVDTALAGTCAPSFRIDKSENEALLHS